LAAAAAPGASVTQANSDYKGLEHVELLPSHVLYDRNQIYAGVKLEICGRKPSGFSAVKVKGHSDPEEASTARGRYEAIGNDFADKVARAAAEAQARASQEELRQWESDKNLLKRYLAYVARALTMWPSLGPTIGKQSRPKLQASIRDQESARGPSSFASDVLGEYAKAHGHRREQQCETPNTLAYEGEVGWEGAAPEGHIEQSSSPQQLQASFKQRPISQPAQKAQPPKEAEAEVEHDWVQTPSYWSCRNCLTRSRATFPPRGKCLGLTPALADLVRDPRGHVLQIAPYSNGSSVILICSRCGRFAGSNRRNTKLHTETCLGVFGSDGARYAYKRVCERKHPTYGKGEAQILEPCLAASALVAPFRPAAGPNSTPELRD
jgi:rubredoxin